MDPKISVSEAIIECGCDIFDKLPFQPIFIVELHGNNFIASCFGSNESLHGLNHLSDAINYFQTSRGHVWFDADKDLEVIELRLAENVLELFQQPTDMGLHGFCINARTEFSERDVRWCNVRCVNISLEIS